MAPTCACSANNIDVCASRIDPADPIARSPSHHTSVRTDYEVGTIAISACLCVLFVLVVKIGVVAKTAVV